LGAFAGGRERSGRRPVVCVSMAARVAALMAGDVLMVVLRVLVSSHVGSGL
jgi:hypothetical protein